MDTSADASRARRPTDPPAATPEGAPGQHAPTTDSERAEQRSDALARAAHELKTPLAVIKGAATTLLSSVGEWDAPTQQELLQLIDAQVDRLLEQVNELLDAWRADPREQMPAADWTFHSGDLTIDFAQHQVWVAGQPVQLSRTEYNLLGALAEHAGRVLSHEQLLERVWGPGYGREVEFLWVYVRRLRRKIEPDPRNPRYILTVPGVGYRLAQL